jgi:hypothetical protein
MARTLCLLLAYAAVAQAAPQVVRVDPSPQRPLPRSPFSATFSRHPPPPFTGATHSLSSMKRKQWQLHWFHSLIRPSCGIVHATQICSQHTIPS